MSTQKRQKRVASEANCAFRNTNEMREIRITIVYTRNGVVELKSRLNGKKRCSHTRFLHGIDLSFSLPVGICAIISHYYLRPKQWYRL